MKKHFHTKGGETETTPVTEAGSSNDFLTHEINKEKEVRQRFVLKQDQDGGDSNRIQDEYDDDDVEKMSKKGYTLYLRDGKRRIDMVMCYEQDLDVGKKEQEMINKVKRFAFQKSLEQAGLLLEVEPKENSLNGKTVFIKVHAPKEALQNTLEPLNIKMPIKEDKFEKPSEKPSTIKNVFAYNVDRIGVSPRYVMAPYNKDSDEQFLDIETMLTPAQRSQIVWTIMLRGNYGDVNKVGIRRLVHDKVYHSAYPLHEGKYNEDSSHGVQLDRRLLYLEWARPAKWYKTQPIWLIRKYFGEQIGLYFAWLGFYTTMLIPAAVVGLLVFIYGLASMGSKENIPSSEICDPNGAGKISLCPMCDKACDYMTLGDSCFFAKLTYLFDNPATVFYAVFMSFWATSFLEIWKRRQKILEWKWNLHDIEDDLEPRLEYEANADKKKYKIRQNPITGKDEPYIPFWNRAVRYTATLSMVLFMVSIVVAALLGTIIYRISVLSVIYSSPDDLLQKNAKLISSSTAALINLVIIIILTGFYKWLAVWMVNLENPRTQSEFEDSYTIKIFVFQFVNYYSSLIYIAFFKGRFFVTPGDEASRATGILQLRNDVCDPAGCLPELFIQLAITMVGKQAFNNVMSLVIPALANRWRRRTQKQYTSGKATVTSWEDDMHLGEEGRLALFEEYLEMVLQYGFVTLFVAAFPLAPLFALINNIFEIRLDAYKMLVQTKRRVGQRVKDIGAWYGILKAVTFCAVVFNGFVIAFTSEFIPRLVYQMAYSPTSDLRGYIDFSLSAFNTSDYGPGMGPDTGVNPEICQYRGYRNGPDSEDKYAVSIVFWHVFTARLAFVVVFEHIVFALTGIMAYLIPDVPASIKLQMSKEKLQVTEAKYDHVARAREQWLKKRAAAALSKGSAEELATKEETTTKRRSLERAMEVDTSPERETVL